MMVDVYGVVKYLVNYVLYQFKSNCVDFDCLFVQYGIYYTIELLSISQWRFNYKSTQYSTGNKTRYYLDRK